MLLLLGSARSATVCACILLFVELIYQACRVELVRARSTTLRLVVINRAIQATRLHYHVLLDLLGHHRIFANLFCAAWALFPRRSTGGGLIAIHRFVDV